MAPALRMPRAQLRHHPTQILRFARDVKQRALQSPWRVPGA
jgi:hypothetical protein